MWCKSSTNNWRIILALNLRTTAASVSMVRETKEYLRVKPACIEKTKICLKFISLCQHGDSEMKVMIRYLTKENSIL